MTGHRPLEHQLAESLALLRGPTVEQLRELEKDARELVDAAALGYVHARAQRLAHKLALLRQAAERKEKR